MKTSAKVVLVVEDNDLNLKLFHDLLEMHGYNVLQVKDGMEGWRIAREQCQNLILMDIQLPGVTGLEVGRHGARRDTRRSACEADSRHRCGRSSPSALSAS